MMKHGDWGLGIGDWGLGIGPNPQSPIPHPQSPIPIIYIHLLIKFIFKIFLNIIKKIYINKKAYIQYIQYIYLILIYQEKNHKKGKNNFHFLNK